MIFLAEFAYLNPDLIFVLDENGIILEANPSGVISLCNKEDNNMIGQDFIKYIAAEHIKDFKTVLTNKHISQNDIILFETKLIDVSSEEKWFQIQVLRSPTKPIIYLHCKDLSSTLEIEQAMEIERQKSFHNSKLAALGQMAGGIAHEINNPLAVIIMSAENVATELEKIIPDSQKIRKGILRVISQSERIGKIVQGLRNISRNDIQESKHLVSVATLIDDVVALCEEKFRRASIKLEISQFEDFDAPCRQVQIQQIFLNLLNNSFDAVSSENEKWIQVNIRKLPETFELSVTDSGPAIPADVVEKIMQPFFTTKEIGKGTGLGLSISCALAKDHGGRLYYDRSSANTRFVLEIPLIETASVINITEDDGATADILEPERKKVGS